VLETKRQHVLIALDVHQEDARIGIAAQGQSGPKIVGNRH
jgi:hypothetical protein